jgi:serine/threonine-protein kinase
VKHEPRQGERLGSYEVGVLLGHGSMASVYEGQHVELGKPVAIKVLAPELAARAPLRDRFVRHGRSTAGLDHPHVAQILDAGVEGAVAYLVTERLRGERLSDLLRDAGPLSVENALAVLLPAASAVALAHARGLAHGHLGPREVFVTRDRHGDAFPKIADFGLARAVIESGARVDPSVDQRGLAATLLEAVTGVAPAEGAPLAGGSLPEGLRAALARALAPEPGDRFADVRELVRALLPFADAATAHAWERDFAEAPPTSRISGRVFGAPSSAPASETLLDMRPSIPPKLPCPPGTSTFYIKGLSYRGVVRFIESKLPGGFGALSEELGDPELVAFLRQPFLPTSRYDILPMLPINAGIARRLGKPLGALAAEQGMAQACHDVQYVYRRMFEAMTLDTIHSYVPRVGDQYFEFGEYTAEGLGPGHLLVHRRRLPEYVLPWFAPAHAAYLEEVVRWKGGGAVHATLRPPFAAATRRGLAMVDVDTEVRWRV